MTSRNSRRESRLHPERIVRGKTQPSEIRLVEADALVQLRRSGEELGLSGRWPSQWLDRNLVRGIPFLIHVVVINTLPSGTSYVGAPIRGQCYRCLVRTRLVGDRSVNFFIDLDSVDFESLPVATPDQIREFAHKMMDESIVEGIWRNEERTVTVENVSSGIPVTMRLQTPDSLVSISFMTDAGSVLDCAVTKSHARRLGQALCDAAERVDGELH